MRPRSSLSHARLSAGPDFRLESRLAPAQLADARAVLDFGDVSAADGHKNALTRYADRLMVSFLPGQDASATAALTASGAPLAGFTMDAELQGGAAILALEEAAAGNVSDRYTRLESLAAAARLVPGVRAVDPVFHTAEGDSWVAPTGRVIVRLEDGQTPEAFFTGDARFGAYEQVGGLVNTFVADTFVRGADSFALANAVDGDGRVRWSQAEWFADYQKHFTPNDTLIGDQWHLNNTGQKGGTLDADADLFEAWDTNAGGSATIVVAVVDDGMETTHPDLAPNIFVNAGETAGDGKDNDNNGYIDDVSGWDFNQNDNAVSNSTADDNHATSVAGIAAGKGNNSLGVAGAAYNSKILPVRIFEGNTFAGNTAVAAATTYAAGINKSGTGTWASVSASNHSWGGGGFDVVLRDAFVASATLGRAGLGTATFVSSGNGGGAAVSYPALYSTDNAGVIAVGASTDSDNRAGYSQYGVGLGLLSPSDGGAFGTVTADITGAGGYNTAAGTAGDYTNTAASAFGGTSSASPLAAGIGALVFAQAASKSVTLSAQQMTAYLKATTDLINPATAGYDAKTGISFTHGSGRINANTAVLGVGKAEIQVFDAQTNAALAATGGTLAFGNTFVGQERSLLVRVRNQGTSTLDLSSATVAGAGFTLDTPPGDTSLTVGESTWLAVRFAPASAGALTGTLTIASNDADEASTVVNLTGTGVAPAIGGRLYDDVDGSGTFTPGDIGLAGRAIWADFDNSGTGFADEVFSNTTASPIPDNNTGGVTSNIAVTGAGTAGNVDVTINITHTWDADLDIFLIAPGGTKIALAQDLGGSGDNYTNTIFDQEAATAIAAGAAPFSGRFRPEGDLGTLAGLTKAGTWSLFVRDDAGSDTGTLNNWSLTFVSTETVPTDANGSYVFATAPAGTYFVAPAPLAGYAVTAPASGKYSVTNTGAGFTTTGKDFAAQQFNTVYGRVVRDQGTIGTIEAGDPGLPGFTVFDDADGDSSLDTSAAQNFASGAINLAIPDNNATGVNSTKAVAGLLSVVTDVNVTVNVTHTFTGDLEFFLTGPGGQKVSLISRRGGSGDNFVSTVLDDEAATSIATGAAPFTGSFRPESPLSAFDGISGNGNWTLTVADQASLDTGTIGSWSLDIASAEPNTVTNASGGYALRGLAAGTHKVLEVIQPFYRRSTPAPGPVSVALAANNFARAATIGLEFDNTPPTVDVVDVTPDPRNTAVTSVAIAFNEVVTGFDAADLALTRGGAPVALTGVTVTGSGKNYTVTGLAALTGTDGTYVLTLNPTGSGVLDGFGNALAVGASDTWLADFTDPGAPTGLTMGTDTGVSNADGITSDTTPTLSGTAEANSTVTVYRNGTSLGTAPAGGAGAWSFTAAVTPDGAYTFSAKATDAVGNQGAAASLAVTIDTLAPVADITDVTPDPRDTVVASIGIVFDGSVVGLDLADLSLTRDGAPVSLAGATLAGTGKNYTLGGLSIPTNIDGVYVLTLAATGTGITDLAGNAIVGGATDTWVINLPGPITPQGVRLVNDTGASATDGVTSSANPVIAGTGEAGSNVVVQLGGTTVGTGVVGIDGKWSVTVSATADGAHTFAVFGTDATGTSPTVDLPVTVDTVALAPGVGGLVGDTGSSATDGVTSVNSPVLNLTAEAGASVTVSVNGTPLAPLTAGPGGTLQAALGTGLADGTYVVSVAQTDIAGNASAASSFTIVIDTVIAVPTLALGAGDDTGSSAGDGVTRIAAPDLGGAAEDGAVVELFRDGTSVGMVAAAGGLWSAASAGLADGTYAFTAKATDLAGNVSTVASFTVVIDTTIATPAVTGLASDSGVSNSDGLTRIANTKVNATSDATAGLVVRLTGPGGTADLPASWLTDPTRVLADGTYSVVLLAEDLAGNTAQSAPFAFTIDTVVGTPTAGLDPASNSGDSATDGLTNVSRPTLTGAAEDGTAIEVFRDGVSLGGTVAAGGSWSFTPAAAFSDGAYSVFVRSADAAGNLATSAAFPLVIDTKVGAVTLVGTGGLSRDNGPRVEGTAGPGDTVLLLRDGVEVARVVADAAGNWAYTSPALPDGLTAFVARGSDAAGNRSAPSNAVAFAIDTAAPAVTLSPATASPGSPGLAVSGTSSEAATLELLFNGSAFGARAVGAGGWSGTLVVPPTLPPGAYSVTVRATDAAGNVSETAFPTAVVVPVPGVPVVPVTPVTPVVPVVPVVPVTPVVPVVPVVPGAATRFTVTTGGGGTLGVYDSTGRALAQYRPYTANEVPGGIRATLGDLNGDGVPDVIAAPGEGGPPVARVISGATREVFRELVAFETTFTGGISVAAGDINGDGVPEVVVTANNGGGGRVRVYDGKTLRVMADFFGIDDPEFRGGARATVADLDGDGLSELIVAAGVGGGPRVALFRGASVAAGRPERLIGDFFAYEPALRDGVFLSSGDVDGDGFADLLTAGGPGGSPRVTLLSGFDLARGETQILADFFAGPSDSRAGARVALKDFDSDGRSDLVVGSGEGERGEVRIYAAASLLSAAPGQPTRVMDLSDMPGAINGVYVG